MSRGPVISSPAAFATVRRSRRSPRITQPDYLHLRALVAGLERVYAELPAGVVDVLDVWCGTRAYDDLLPPGSRCTGLDVVGNPYGVADVVSDELLPFPDASFDLVTCIEAFQYMPRPQHSVDEMRRVLRPGGTAVVSLVFGFDYDRGNSFEGRYTEHQLEALFSSWDDVRIHEDGGRTVTWTSLTTSLLFGLEQRAEGWRARAVHPLFAGSYAALNGLGRGLARIEPHGSDAAFPTNLTLVATKPAA